MKGHVPTDVSIDIAIDAGIDQIEHLSGWLDADTASILISDKNAILEKLVDNGVVVCPTLLVYRRVVPGNQVGKFKALPGADRQPIAFRWMERLAARSMRNNVEIDLQLYQNELVEQQNEALRTLYNHGVQIVAGTDSGNPYVYPGFSLHEEMRSMHAAGMSVIDVIRSATVVAARAMKLHERGIVSKGAHADLLLLSANPLESLANLSNIEAVILRGKYLDLNARQ